MGSQLESPFFEGSFASGKIHLECMRISFSCHSFLRAATPISCLLASRQTIPLQSEGTSGVDGIPLYAFAWVESRMRALMISYVKFYTFRWAGDGHIIIMHVTGSVIMRPQVDDWSLTARHLRVHVA